MRLPEFDELDFPPDNPLLDSLLELPLLENVELDFPLETPLLLLFELDKLPELVEDLEPLEAPELDLDLSPQVTDLEPPFPSVDDFLLVEVPEFINLSDGMSGSSSLPRVM